MKKQTLIYLLTMVIVSASFLAPIGIWTLLYGGYPPKSSPIWTLTLIGLLPLLIHLSFGPGIVAYWLNRKSRFSILSWNVIVVLVGLFTGIGFIPGIGLWLWAILGKRDDLTRRTNRQPTESI
jgi:hypothetical protein